MKLCTCNHCGKVYEDMNPQIVSKEYPKIQVEPLIKLYVETNKPETGYWGCPLCCTDGYLQDDINYEALTRIDTLILKKKLWEHEPRETRGEDCTEDDSAFIKGWLRDTIIQPESDDTGRLEDIQRYFPIEYGEHLDESETKF